MRGYVGGVVLLSLLAAAPQLATGCTPKRRYAGLSYAESARLAYEEALIAHLDRDWETSKTLMAEVKEKYAYSRYARLAELRIADADYHLGKYPEAVAKYRAYAQEHPNDPETPYARFRLAKTLFEQTGDAILLPPLEERDLASVRDAYRTIRAFLRDYPGHEKVEELEYMLQLSAGTLARHELYVARFYLERSNFEAAVGRCNFALERYEESGLGAEALVLLGETYLKMKKRLNARKAFVAVLKRYPTSAFTRPARRFLKYIETHPAAGRVAAASADSPTPSGAEQRRSSGAPGKPAPGQEEQPAPSGGAR